MKNLVCLLFFAFVSFNVLSAQEYTAMNVNMDGGDVEILKEFKATKEQKKAIKKIKNYVSPRVLGRNVSTEAFEGKSVKLQVGLDANGGVDHIVVINSIGPKIDEKVANLVKEYVENKPVAVAFPAVIQMDIPLKGSMGKVDGHTPFIDHLMPQNPNLFALGNGICRDKGCLYV